MLGERWGLFKYPTDKTFYYPKEFTIVFIFSQDLNVCNRKMRGSTFQVSSLSPSEEEVFKLLLLLKAIAERFTKQEFQFIFDQRNIYLHCVPLIENNMQQIK